MSAVIFNTRNVREVWRCDEESVFITSEAINLHQLTHLPATKTLSIKSADWCNRTPKTQVTSRRQMVVDILIVLALVEDCAEENILKVTGEVAVGR